MAFQELYMNVSKYLKKNTAENVPKKIRYL
jgi:hypothetical protein